VGLAVEDAEPEDMRRLGLAVAIPLEGSHTQAGGSRNGDEMGDTLGVCPLESVSCGIYYVGFNALCRIR